MICVTLLDCLFAIGFIGPAIVDVEAVCVLSLQLMEISGIKRRISGSLFKKSAFQKLLV